MRGAKIIYTLFILFSITWFSACETYDDLYGTGDDDKKKKNECSAAAALYLSCSSANPGTYSTACSNEYLLAVGACGYGGGGGGGGGGGY